MAVSGRKPDRLLAFVWKLEEPILIFCQELNPKNESPASPSFALFCGLSQLFCTRCKRSTRSD